MKRLYLVVFGALVLLAILISYHWWAPVDRPTPKRDIPTERSEWERKNAVEKGANGRHPGVSTARPPTERTANSPQARRISDAGSRVEGAAEPKRSWGLLLMPPVEPGEESEILGLYRSWVTNRNVDIAAQSLQMLGSTNPVVRMTGAILLIEQQRGLDESQMQRLASDEAVVVPLTVLGWLRDAGLSSYAARMEALCFQRKDLLEKAVEALRDEGLNSVAGRAALCLVDKSDLPPEEKRELMVDVLWAVHAHYLVRWHAALLLRYQMDFSNYQAVIRDVLAPGSSSKSSKSGWGAGVQTVSRPVSTAGDSLFRLAMLLVNERTVGPIGVMEQRVTLTKDDADLFFAHESSLMLENVAAWLELAVEKPEFVSVESEFLAAVREYLEQLPREELPTSQLLALRRIESRLAVMDSR